MIIVMVFMRILCQLKNAIRFQNAFRGLMSAIGARNLRGLYIISTEPAGFAVVSAETKSRRRQPTKNKTTQTNSPQWSARHGTKKPNNIDKKLSARTLLVWPDKNRLEMTRAALCGSIQYFFYICGASGYAAF